MDADAPADPDPARAAEHIAHDLGTALVVVSGHAESLRDALGASAAGGDVGAALDGIDRGVARMRGVSERLAAWAREQDRRGNGL